MIYILYDNSSCLRLVYVKIILRYLIVPQKINKTHFIQNYYWPIHIFHWQNFSEYSFLWFSPQLFNKLHIEIFYTWGTVVQLKEIKMREKKNNSFNLQWLSMAR